MLLLALCLLPLVAGAVAWPLRRSRAQLALLLGTSALHLGATASLWVRPPAPLGAFFVLDPLGLLFLTLASLLFLAASVYSVAYLRDGTHDQPAAVHRYVPCLLWFLAAMTLVTLTHNLAVMWAAVEATTLASAPLIYFYRRRSALEATWKYLLICSVGIAIALLGTFFLGIAASATTPTPALTLPELSAAAPGLARPWLRAAFVLALVGYGSKMGLAPLHTWLPDAHSQAPSPVSALLSGALLNCALLGILRFHQVSVAAGETAFARPLLLTLGFVSLGVATAFIVGQRDYKRLLAYSSVENMGVVTVGLGLGGAATYGALLHAVNHSLIKAALFFLAGNLLRVLGTTSVAGLGGARRLLPWSGVLLLAALFAVGGAPPFGAFMSELLILRWALAAHLWLGVLFAALLALAFLGMAGVLLPLSQGPASRPPVRESALAVAPPLVLTAAVLVLGLWVPPFLGGLLHRAAQLLGGG